MAIGKCFICKKYTDVVKVEGNYKACKKHAPAIRAILKHPEAIIETWPRFRQDAIIPIGKQIKIAKLIGTPDELDGTRYKKEDREKNTWYIMVSEYKNKPVEILTSTAEDNNHNLQSRIANVTTITRLISLILRHVFLHEPITLDKVKDQLRRSSRNKNDVPDMILSTIDKYKV